MRNDEWSAARVAAALARLEDAGHSQPDMARTAGISQSTVNRWSRGKVQPGYGAIRRLAVAVWRRHPDIARELVEASGYAWAEPTQVDTPPPPVITPEEEAYIRNGTESAEEAEATLAWLRDRRMRQLRATGGEPAA